MELFVVDVHAEMSTITAVQDFGTQKAPVCFCSGNALNGFPVWLQHRHQSPCGFKETATKVIWQQETQVSVSGNDG